MPFQIPKVWKCMPFLSISIWISNFVQHRSQVCLVIISWRMWRQMAQKAAARVSVRGVLQNNCSIARICSNTNITSEQFFVRVPRMVPRQDAGNTLQITGTRSSLTSGKLPSWGSGNPRVSAPLWKYYIKEKYFHIFSKRYDMYSFINVSAVGVVSGVFCRELRRKRGREECYLLTARRDLGEERACRLCVRTSAR